MKVTQFKVAQFQGKWEAMLYYNDRCHRVAKSKHEKVALFLGMLAWARYDLKLKRTPNGENGEAR